LKSDFLANMSHELRTPLNSIIGFSDVLKDIETLDSRQKRYVQRIQKSGRVLLEMINDILDLAKMEAGKMDVRAGDFSIEAIVSAQCDLVRALAEEKNIDLTVQAEPDLPLLHQDQSKVQQILTNLLSNAVKFTEPGGTVRVHSHTERHGPSGANDPGDWTCVTVEDTGVGIPEEQMERIFEPFEQGDSSYTRTQSGTGLGLAISRRLAHMMGGELTVTSEPGQGSRFTLWLQQPARAERSA
jgi:signal transduction histidine kinase